MTIGRNSSKELLVLLCSNWKQGSEDFIVGIANIWTEHDYRQKLFVKLINS